MTGGLVWVLIPLWLGLGSAVLMVARRRAKPYPWEER